jgi:hypothetical protein
MSRAQQNLHLGEFGARIETHCKAGHAYGAICENIRFPNGEEGGRFSPPPPAEFTKTRIFRFEIRT